MGSGSKMNEITATSPPCSNNSEENNHQQPKHLRFKKQRKKKRNVWRLRTKCKHDFFSKKKKKALSNKPAEQHPMFQTSSNEVGRYRSSEQTMPAQRFPRGSKFTKVYNFSSPFFFLLLQFFEVFIIAAARVPGDGGGGKRR